MRGSIRFGAGRIALGADVALSVSSAGNDATGSLTTPFATLGGAYAWVQRNLDLRGFSVTARLSNSFVNMTGALSGPLVGATGAGNFIIELGGYSLSSTIPGFFLLYGNAGAQFTVQGGTLEPPSGGIGIVCAGGDIVYRGMNFNANGGHACLDVLGNEAAITCGGPWAVTAIGSNTLDYVLIGEDEAEIWLGGPLTISGTPHWNNAFIQADLRSLADCTGFTFTGSATGCRGNASTGSTLFTSAGAPAGFFPGSAAVTVDRSSQYI